MFKFSTKKFGEVSVRFQYEHGRRDRTTAVLSKKVLDNYDVLATYTVTRYYKDVYDKKLSRKLAFEGMLKEAGLDREDRMIAWDVFKSNVVLL